ncbi:protein THEM6 [Ctenocephalides felis]|uniref:protein THEM6 n=1 Tax=Ctenocephalides felis TaxID=7515 RepID=UPI000E6E561B|nr:protein THEM6 [Ctenocephalides felis]
MNWCIVLVSVFGGILLMYVLLELHYFLRMFLCVVYARYCRKKCHILDTTTVTGICLTTDIDTLLYHMNNARYLREIDFARVDFYERTGLYRSIIQNGGAVVQGASTIRYRRFIRPFSKYRITSKIVYWDDKSIFMEHRFISCSDQFILAIAICRQRLISCDARDAIGRLLENPLAPAPKIPNYKPAMPLEVAKWIESNEISSAILRSGC